MDKNLFFYELEGRGYIFQNKKWDEAKHVFEDDMLNMAWEMWSSAKHSVKAQAVPEGFVLVPVDQLNQWGHMANYAEQYGCPECFEARGYAHTLTCEINEYFAIEAQGPAPLKLGDLVEPIDHRYTLASGCERYPYAYVVNTNPFQLMSEEGDMYWCCIVEAGGYKLIKSNDQLPEAVSLRMIREGLLAPVETQEQSHENG